MRSLSNAGTELSSTALPSSSSLKKRLARILDRRCLIDPLCARFGLSPLRRPSFMTVVTVEARGEGDMKVPERV